jgi:ketosteroid isomerase-like protein
MRLASVLCLGLLAAACAPKSEVPATAAPLSAAEIDAVKAVDAAFAAAMNAKDTTAVFALYAADAKLMPPDSPVLEGAAIHALVVGFLAGGGGDFVLTQSTVAGVGDLAYVVGTATYKMAGAPETVKYTEVLRKGADGKWQYAVDMFSSVAPPAAAAPAKKN